MGKGIEQKLTNYLLFHDVHSSHHCDESMPGALRKAIGGLATHISSNDFGIIVVGPFEGLTVDELDVNIGVELLGDAICIGAK